MNPVQFQSVRHLQDKQGYNGKKEFKYCVRIPIPMNTSKTSMYKYNQILYSFAEKLAKQLKQQGRKFRTGPQKEGYDQDRGEYMEKIIIAYTNGDNEINQKVIWIEV